MPGGNPITERKEEDSTVTDKREGPRPIRNIDPDLWHQARIEALKEQITVGDWVNRAIRNELERIASGELVVSRKDGR